LIGTVWCNDSGRGDQARARIPAAYEVSEDSFADLPELIKEVIKRSFWSALTSQRF